MGKLSKTLKVLDDVATGAKRVKSLDPDVAPPLRMLDQWEEYEALSGALPSARTVPTQTPIDAQIAAQKAADEASRRSTAISSPDLQDIEYKYQALNPEEFRGRVQNQLFDERYAASVVNNDAYALTRPHITPQQVKTRMTADQLMQINVRIGLDRNPRYVSRVNEITKDSAYGDRVFFHIERQALPDGTLPQFGDTPSETGLHSGTYNAAVQATYKSDEALLNELTVADEMLESLSFPLEMSPKQIRDRLLPVLEDYMYTKAKQGPEAVGRALNDLANDWGTIMRDAGFPEVELSMVLARLRRMSVPSVTPHYFIGKNGLHLSDAPGNWFSDTMLNHLENVFPDDKQALASIRNASRRARPRQIQHFIESKGYDHVVYHNQAEDIGTVSIINWNEDLMVPIWDSRLVDGSTDMKARGQASYLLAVLGFGNATLRDEK